MKNPLIAGINLYQKAFSPYKGAGSFCKYYPTCSQYAKRNFHGNEKNIKM